jgi:hypothetical protein
MTRRKSALIVAAEVAVMVAATAVAFASDPGLITAPLVALVSCLHFFPLAWLFAQRRYVLMNLMMHQPRPAPLDPLLADATSQHCRILRIRSLEADR